MGLTFQASPVLGGTGAAVCTPTPGTHTTVDGTLIANLDVFVTVHGQYMTARDAQAAGLIGCYQQGPNVRYRLLRAGDAKTSLA